MSSRHTTYRTISETPHDISSCAERFVGIRASPDFERGESSFFINFDGRAICKSGTSDVFLHTGKRSQRGDRYVPNPHLYLPRSRIPRHSTHPPLTRWQPGPAHPIQTVHWRMPHHRILRHLAASQLWPTYVKSISKSISHVPTDLGLATFFAGERPRGDITSLADFSGRRPIRYRNRTQPSYQPQNPELRTDCTHIERQEVVAKG